MEQRKLPDTFKKKVLFIAAQAGQASYLNPLWEKWLGNTPDNIDFKIWASPDAVKLMDERLSSYLYPWDQRNILENFKPDLIVSSACGEEQELRASQYAQKNNSKHIQFIDTFYDTKKRIDVSNPENMQPHEIWLIHEYASNHEIADDIIQIVGHPNFEAISKVSKNPKNNKHVIVFAAQPISEIKGLKDNLGYDENDVWNYLQTVKKAHPDIIRELIYAPHPVQKKMPEMNEGERLLNNSETIDDLNGILVGMFSAVLIEQYIKGRRVISIQPNLKCENKDILSNKSLVPLVVDQGQDALLQALEEIEIAYDNEFAKSFDGSLNRIEERIWKNL